MAPMAVPMEAPVVATSPRTRLELVDSTDRLRRIDRAIAELEAEKRPAWRADALLAALRRERQSLVAPAGAAPDPTKPRRGVASED